MRTCAPLMVQILCPLAAPGKFPSGQLGCGKFPSGQLGSRSSEKETKAPLGRQWGARARQRVPVSASERALVRTCATLAHTVALLEEPAHTVALLETPAHTGCAHVPL